MKSWRSAITPSTATRSTPPTCRRSAVPTPLRRGSRAPRPRARRHGPAARVRRRLAHPGLRAPSAARGMRYGRTVGCPAASVLAHSGDGAVVNRCLEAIGACRSDRRVRWLRDLRTLPPWRQALYWLASIAALALVIWDIADQGAQYTSIVVLALVVIATVALRAPSGRRERP